MFFAGGALPLGRGIGYGGGGRFGGSFVRIAAYRVALRRTAFGLLCGTAFGLLSCAGSPPEPSPPEEAFPVTLHADNESCSSCHVSIYEAWLQSRHAQAWRSPLFRLTSENYTRQECLGCHAPGMITAAGVAQEPALRSELRDQGVDCIACHQDASSDDWVMHGPYGADSPAHGTILNEAFASSEVCASCHGHAEEFNQYHAWRESEYGAAGFTCQGCHMVPEEALLADTEPDYPLRWVGDHSFPGGHSPEVVEGAVSLELRMEEGVLLAVLENHAAHDFPGGAYRSAVLEAFADGEPVGQKEYRFALGNRLQSGVPAEERFAVPGGASEASVRLTYYRDGVGEDGSVVREAEGILVGEERLDIP